MTDTATAEARAKELGVEVPTWIGQTVDVFESGEAQRMYGVTANIGTYWVGSETAGLVDVSLTDDERAAGDRKDAAAKALREYVETHVDRTGEVSLKPSYDPETAKALANAWAVASVEQHVANTAYKARVDAANTTIAERIDRGEPPFPLPTDEDIAAELAKRGISPDSDPRDLDYESDLLVRAARKVQEQREIEARIDAMTTPEAVAEREAADKKVAAAWKAFMATEKAAGMRGTGRSNRWARYVKDNPDLDLGVETPSWNDEDNWKFIRAHARDQKGTSLPARIAVSSFAGTETGITAFIRSDRVADVMRAHQRAVTPEQFTRGHGEGLGFQAVAVSPKRYAHEGKVYREVILTRRDPSAPANAIYAWRSQLARMDKLSAAEAVG